MGTSRFAHAALTRERCELVALKLLVSAVLLRCCAVALASSIVICESTAAAIASRTDEHELLTALDTLDSSVLTLAGKYSYVSEHEEWFKELMNDPSSRAASRVTVEWSERRAPMASCVEETFEFPDGKLSKYRHTFDGRNSTTLRFPDGLRLHHATRLTDRADYFRFGYLPSRLLGLWVEEGQGSLAVLARKTGIKALGEEVIHKATCAVIELTFPHHAMADTQVIVRAHLDRGMQSLPRKVHIAFAHSDQVQAQWSSEIVAWREARDEMTATGIHVPQSIIQSIYYEGKPSQRIKHSFDEFRVNPVLPDSTWSTDLKTLPDGVRVEDRVAFPHGENYVTGNRKDLFQERAQELHPTKSTAPGQPSRAIVRRYDLLLGAVGVGISGVVIAVGVWLRRRA